MLLTVQVGPIKKLVYAPKDAALILGCSVQIVHQCIAENILGNIRVLDQVRYPTARDVAEILLWIAAYPDLSVYEAALARHDSIMRLKSPVPR